MAELITICLAALTASLLTFFSGFGLGTILTPVFAVYFPIDLAIALTGVVHFLNNIFKLSLTGMKADAYTVVRFGIPAFLAAMLGAYVLLQINNLPSIHSYVLWNNEYSITPVKLTIAVLLAFFALTEVLPFFKNLQFGKSKTALTLILGGLLSGFFGGLSGNQGALRTAFLIKSGLNKTSFIATGIVIACIVDFSRLGVYMTRFTKSGLHENLALVIGAAVSAFIGAYAGNLLLEKVTFVTVQRIVTLMLVLFSIALGFGIV